MLTPRSATSATNIGSGCYYSQAVRYEQDPGRIFAEARLWACLTCAKARSDDLAIGPAVAQHLKSPHPWLAWFWLCRPTLLCLSAIVVIFNVVPPCCVMELQ